MTYNRWLITAVGIAILISAAGAIYSQTPPRNETNSGGGQALRLEVILNYIAQNRSNKNSYPESVLIKQIETRGISFDPTPADFTAIQNAGGSQNLIAAVENAAKPVVSIPPLPVASPKESQLVVSCKPVDCEVWINGDSARKLIGTTVHGELSTMLPEGRARVSATKKDYEPNVAEQLISISADHSARVEFNLKVSRSALDAAGSALFERMMEAFGGPTGLKGASTVLGSGFLEVYGRDGQPSRWPAPTIVTRSPDKARFELRRANQTYDLVDGGEGFSWAKQPPKGQEFADLEDEIPLVVEYQLGRMLERLNGNGLQMTATALEPPSGEGGEFRAHGGPDTYVVILDPKTRPKEIQIESVGLNSGLRILFSDYENLGNTFYPKVTQVIQPGTVHRGVLVNLDKVELNPGTVKDSDFALPKKKGGSPFNK